MSSEINQTFVDESFGLSIPLTQIEEHLKLYFQRVCQNEWLPSSEFEAHRYVKCSLHELLGSEPPPGFDNYESPEAATYAANAPTEGPENESIKGQLRLRDLQLLCVRRLRETFGENVPLVELAKTTTQKNLTVVVREELGRLQQSEEGLELPPKYEDTVVKDFISSVRFMAVAIAMVNRGENPLTSGGSCLRHEMHVAELGKQHFNE